MPQVRYEVSLKDVFTPQERMIMELVVEQLNVLRVRAGLPALTEAQVKTALRNYIAAHPEQNWVRPKPA